MPYVPARSAPVPCQPLRGFFFILQVDDMTHIERLRPMSHRDHPLTPIRNTYHDVRARMISFPGRSPHRMHDVVRVSAPFSARDFRIIALPRGRRPFLRPCPCLRA